MLNFADTEYKWCTQCAGNIRLKATYCRFCHKPIENRLMKRIALPSFVTVRSIKEWLPSFAAVKAKLPADFLMRLEQAESETPKDQIGESMEAQRLREGGESLCLHEPPEANVTAVLMDLLLAVYSNGESIADICDQPQIKLLEITPQEVIAEYELRLQEFEKGFRCTHCQEYIFDNGEDCRFCQGTRDRAPRPIERNWEKPVDPLLLKDVILYEAAWRTIMEEEAIPQEILSINAVSQSDLDREILRLRAGDVELPVPRFTKRMVELNLKSYWTPEQIALSAIGDLGSALGSRTENRSQEALIVLEHALRRTEGDDELMSQRSAILSKLSTYYLARKDDAKYQLYNSMSHECSKFGMSEEMKAMMDKSHESMKGMLKSDTNFETDPAKRLASLNADFGLNMSGMDDMFAQIEETLPGMGEFFASLQSGLEATMKNTRLVLEAQVAENNGDLATAESKYREALANNNEDGLTGTLTRITTITALGQIKHKQGDNAEGEALLKESMVLAMEYAEAEPSLGNTSLFPALTAYACFLRDVGRHAEAEQKFQQALQVEDESSAKFIKDYGGSAGDYSCQNADIKEKYAQLLRVMNREDEAQKLEDEVVVLRKEGAERQAELEQRRSGH